MAKQQDYPGNVRIEIRNNPNKISRKSYAVIVKDCGATAGDDGCGDYTHRWYFDQMFTSRKAAEAYCKSRYGEIPARPFSLK